MKLKHLAAVILALVTFVPAALADGDVVSAAKQVNRYFQKRPTQKHAILSTGICAVGVTFSANPAGAAAVGIPVLALGNFTAYLLRNAKPGAYQPNVDAVTFFHNVGRYVGKHPTLLQDASGAFCLGYGLSRAGRVHYKPAAKTPKPPTNGGNPPSDPQQPPTGPGSGNGGGNGGGSGSGGSGGGNPPPPPNPPPPVRGPCTVHGGTDCGIGNGGINPSPNPKPPVTPPGQVGKPPRG